MLCRNLSCICTKSAVIAINFQTTKRSTEGKLGLVCRFATFEHVAREAVGVLERVLAVSDDNPTDLLSHCTSH